MNDHTLILKKSDVAKFLEGLSSAMQIIAPRQAFGGDALFGPVESPSEILWNYGHVVYPPKQFVFPHHDDLFRYQVEKTVRIEDLCQASHRAIIGIRSCDVVAIRAQENFFLSQIEDPYFKARIENTVLFSLVCGVPPKEECFCICCDAGPYLSRGYDVQLTDLGDCFLYEIGSEKGERASAATRHMLAQAEEQHLARRREIELEADSLFQTTGYLAKCINFISANEVPQSIWEDLGATCFKCGACTNLCPICTCYMVEDRSDGDGCYTRCRSWDSCQYAGFTREASGHNPRPTFGSRVQRRFFHKASYQYIMRDGRHGCVGCGRCVIACLTKLGMPAVLKRIRRAMHDYLEPRAGKTEV